MSHHWIGETTAAEYAEQLKTDIHDNQRFDMIIEKLKNDRNMTAEHLQKIAGSFLGYLPKVRTKTGLIGQITERQMIEQRQLARGRQIDKHMKKW